MEFTRKASRNFQRLYFKYFHKNLSEKEALEKAEYLVRAYEAVYGYQTLSNSLIVKRKSNQEVINN